MIRTIADFKAAWKFESEATLKVLRGLTDASLAQAEAPGHRTLGFMAWHITTTLAEMMSAAGIPVAGPKPDAAVPAEAAAIAAAYEKGAKELVEAVEANWTDQQLADEIEMYGEKWKKGFVLASLLAHQTHHRGQMTVLMRQAGLRVPGVYGPSQEEWSAYGMPPQP
jgi:uncharacterized damage-inducible protein DinB